MRRSRAVTLPNDGGLPQQGAGPGMRALSSACRGFRRSGCKDRGRVACCERRFPIGNIVRAGFAGLHRLDLLRAVPGRHYDAVALRNPGTVETPDGSNHEHG